MKVHFLALALCYNMDIPIYGGGTMAKKIIFLNLDVLSIPSTTGNNITLSDDDIKNIITNTPELVDFPNDSVHTFLRDELIPNVVLTKRPDTSSKYNRYICGLTEDLSMKAIKMLNS